jgi:hypothetical protein
VTANEAIAELRRIVERATAEHAERCSGVPASHDLRAWQLVVDALEDLAANNVTGSPQVCKLCGVERRECQHTWTVTGTIDHGRYETIGEKCTRCGLTRSRTTD